MRILLVDGDIFAYRAAAASERTIEWEPGMFTLHSDLEEAKRLVTDCLHDMREKVESLRGKIDGIILAFTDGVNFRKAILPTYKANRQGARKPLCYEALRDWLTGEYKSYKRPGLEGDDCLGILATKITLPPTEFIIVSFDKDMKTIPGLHYNPSHGDILVVDEATAAFNHMRQTLTGDSTDGYSGCPGIGPKKADAILLGVTDGNYWPAVVAAFKKAGLGEEAALQQAQVARICLASDYDFKNKKPIPWTPP